MEILKQHKYSEIKLLDKGAFGAVYKVLSPDKGGCVRAVKVQIAFEDDTGAF